MSEQRMARAPGDEAEIRGLIAAWSNAAEAKDAGGIVAAYAPDAVLFDAIPPYRTQGADAIRRIWEKCLPYFPETFQSEHRDLSVTVDGDLAVVHGLHHFKPTPSDHPCGRTWMRVTVCYRRSGGRWRVFHEHVSIPFDPSSGQVSEIADV